MRDIYISRQQWHQAIELIKSAIANDSTKIGNYLRLGDLYLQKHDTTQALATFNQAIEQFPEDFRSHFAVGRIYFQAQKWDQAVPFLKKSIELNPDFQFRKKMSEKAVAADSTNGAYLDTLGWIYFRLGNYQLAHKYIERAANFRDSSAEVWEHLGDVYEKLNDMEKAKESWRKALDLEASRSHLIDKIGGK
ncbi:hypothetical protein B6D60_11325 [candidate division KSB1 bacterium 4484_87]|nr:MAG: hypothetical protein B6D60_11325 [candidate division KSB1 bacterium 4484_87]